MPPIDLDFLSHFPRPTTTLYVALPASPTATAQNGTVPALPSAAQILPLSEALRSALSHYFPSSFTVFLICLVLYYFVWRTVRTVELGYVDGLRYLHQRIEELHARLDSEDAQWAHSLGVQPIQAFPRYHAETPFGWNLDSPLSSAQQPRPPPREPEQEAKMVEMTATAPSRTRRGRTQHGRPGSGQEQNAPLLD